MDDRRLGFICVGFWDRQGGEQSNRNQHKPSKTSPASVLGSHKGPAELRFECPLLVPCHPFEVTRTQRKASEPCVAEGWPFCRCNPLGERYPSSLHRIG